MEPPTQLLTTANEFVQLLLVQQPEWASHLQKPPFDAKSDAVTLTIPSPRNTDHQLRLLIRSNEIEVHYDDGEGPGAAEALFILDDADRTQSVRNVAQFINDIVNNKIVVVRRRLSRFTRFLRRYDCESLPEFLQSEKLPRSQGKFAAVYSWNS